MPRKPAGGGKPRRKRAEKPAVARRRLATKGPATTAVGTGCEVAGALSKAMYGAPDRNGCVVRGFVAAATGGGGVIAWAKALCKAVRPKAFKMSVHEGIGAEAGEDFPAQLRREVGARFRELLETQSTTGLLDKKKTANGIAGVCAVVEKMADVHRSAVAYPNKGSAMRFKAKLEVNQDGACTKYHDDMVDVRLVTTLVGDGTVIADNSGVNWREYDKSGGYLPEDLAEHDYAAAVRQFNARVVTSGELEMAEGDLGVMKGAKAARRPCLHRAPYSADVGMQLPRLLLTVERMGKKELRDSHELEQDTENMDEDSHGEDCQCDKSKELRRKKSGRKKKSVLRKKPGRSKMPGGKRSKVKKKSAAKK